MPSPSDYCGALEPYNGVGCGARLQERDRGPLCAKCAYLAGGRDMREEAVAVIRSKMAEVSTLEQVADCIANLPLGPRALAAPAPPLKRIEVRSSIPGMAEAVATGLREETDLPVEAAPETPCGECGSTEGWEMETEEVPSTVFGPTSHPVCRACRKSVPFMAPEGVEQ